jgi:hypothetical protein
MGLDFLLVRKKQGARKLPDPLVILAGDPGLEPGTSGSGANRKGQSSLKKVSSGVCLSVLHEWNWFLKLAEAIVDDGEVREVELKHLVGRGGFPQFFHDLYRRLGQDELDHPGTVFQDEDPVFHGVTFADDLLE